MAASAPSPVTATRTCSSPPGSPSPGKWTSASWSSSVTCGGPSSASRPARGSTPPPPSDRLFALSSPDLEAPGAGLKKALGPEDPRMRELLDRLAAEDGLQMDEMTELMLRGEGGGMGRAM